QPTSLTTPVIASTDVDCHGANDGTITVTTAATGGTNPIQYSVDGTIYQAGLLFTGLAPTTYTVTAKDANGCTINSNTVTISEPAASLTAGIVNTNVTCNGFNDGTVTVSPLASGGTPPYVYSLNGGGYSGTTSYTSLSPNSYTVTVKDGNNCVFNTNTVNLTQPAVLVVVASNDGPYYGTTQTIHLFTTVTGGTTAYSYSWNGPLSWSSNSANPSIPNAIVPMTGTYNITVTDANGCTASDTSYVQVNSSATYTWTGAIDANWTTVGNWTPTPLAGGPVGCWADIHIPHVVTNQPVVSSAINIGNLLVDANATLTINADVAMCKDLTGGGGGSGVITGTGSIILDGGIQQKLAGLLKIDRVRLNNSAGAKTQPGASIQVSNSLDLQLGNFDAANAGIVFTSNSVNQVGIIDNFSPGYTGTMNGTIYAQRYYAGGTSANSYNQHFMGSPVSNPAFSQFSASGTSGYIIPTPTCDESHIAANSPYSNVLALDETHGATCTSAQWYAETISSGNAVNGVGYAVARLGAGILTLSGAPNLAPNYSVPNLTNTNWSNVTLQGHTVSSGWHLVSNPYLATLDISTASAGFDNQIQVWNANGPFAGTYQPGLVGVDAIVAPFSGFMVHKTNPGGSANYVMNASDRVRAPHTFFRSNDNELKITAENTTTHLLDQTLVAFNTAATDQFDTQYDADKPSGTLNRHTLYSESNGKWMSRNVLHDIAQTSTVPVGFEPGANATYNFNFTGINTFDATSYVYLEDKVMHIMHDVRSGDYSFTADSGDARERFVLHFTPAAVTAITDAGCTTQGVINVTQPGTANWNYTITDNNNAVIGSGVLNQTSPLAVTAPAGTYTLTLTDINNYTVTEMVQVNGPDPITASFTTSGTTVQDAQNIILTSTTTNATSYNWNMGNGQTESGATVNYAYNTPGTYTVVLTVTNLSGCTSTASQNITVNALATGLNSIVENKSIGIWSNENKVFVDFRGLQKVDAVISIYNILGQQISNEKFTNSLVYQKEIGNIEASYLIVSVKNEDKVTSKKVFIYNIK
ncbi:MAG: hypothetical protein JWO06_2232, partial [Bacteroidota bacterium]|nr:hypothetical protein [Bacteroidota bacterium]